MALRSVVVEAPPPPPAPRHTVVLRAGGPPAKGHAVDIILGILGALLLVAAIVLANILPDRTYLNPQFRLTFAEGGGEGEGTMTAEFAEGTATVHEFTIDVPEHNIKSVTLLLGYADDISYSLPDLFTIDLFAPNGTLAGHLDMANPAPRSGRNATDPPVFSIADERITFQTAPATPEQVVTGLTHTESKEQVLARLEPQYRVSNSGTWTVRVELVAAQDCPNPGDPNAYPAQAVDCRVRHPRAAPDAGVAADGQDLGNSFRLANFSYTFYVPEVQELK